MKWLTGIVILLVVGSTAVLYAIKEYNRVPVSMAATKEDLAVNTGELIRAYEGNATKADSSFLGKTLLVKGVVDGIDSTGPSDITIILRAGTSTTSLRCRLDSSLVGKSIPVKEKDSIELRALCTGYMAGDLGLGADIILNKTFITKKIQ
jgi:hypothetical protein